jgi:peptidyl-prolyl cis-trans isomerase SurA
MPALVGALLCTSAPAQNATAAEPAVPGGLRQAAPPAAPARQNLAATEPAVPNIPRQVTPSSVAAPPEGSPDASRIDAGDGQIPGLPSLPTAPQSGSDEANSVVAMVNDEPISDYELRQRMALVAATTLNTQVSQLKPDDYKRLRGQILEKLEEEKMQFQEAQKKHITVSPVEIDKQINRLLADNHIAIDQLRKMLTDAGSDVEALRTEIEGQIAWQKAVQDEYSDRINITPADIDAEMARYAEGANKPHYLVAEIFLPVDNSDQDAKVQKDAENLETQIQSGASFSALARQFSQSPTAAQGGDIGWVHEGQLSSELNAELGKMKAGMVSQPIRSVGGYYIMALRQRQEPLGTKIAATPNLAANSDGTLKLARLLLPLGPSPTKDLMDNAMKIANQVRGSYAGCDTLAKVQTQLQGSVYTDLGTMKLSELSPEIQKALSQTPPGEMAPVMMDEAGVELIGRCDAKIEVRTAFTMPTRNEVQSELFDQQISALARRYLRDIKRDADVEVR